ncbi:serine/threonine-protein kinase [Actinosynnema sp. NPDC047251]|uniref:serine/threonine-protein kinase n=1 Tax=Saccharothrix espanaensis TaxID=103731 RepID=UPI0002F6EE7C|nr:serine/threonine-protein kinase [Saccharothrix espanaensis]
MYEDRPGSWLPGDPIGAEPVGDRGPLAEVRSTRDGVEVVVLVVTRVPGSRHRARLRDECADLEGRLAPVDPGLVLPLLDHGVDDAGRPFLVLTSAPPVSAGVPHTPDDVARAAKALAAGLEALAAHGVLGPVPPLHHDGSGGFVLGTPLPPAIADLVPPTGHEPPEVLRGEEWTVRGTVFACASTLWALLTGQPPYRADERGRLARLTGERPEAAGHRPEVVEVLAGALALDPSSRPATPTALVRTLVAALSGNGDPTPDRLETLPPAGAVPTTDAFVPFGKNYLMDPTPIGRGATGHVHAGRNRSTGSPVAIKLLRTEYSTDVAVLSRFFAEREVLRGVRHPNIVRVLDLLFEDEQVGIVMDLVEGGDLRSLLSRGPLPLADAAALLGQTATALDVVHANGIVHRDLKPENVLLAGTGPDRTARLTDFGLARVVDAPGRTRFTELRGTQAYLAPELFDGAPPTPATDVYALGITAYELLAGRRPFAEGTDAALMRAHLEREPERPDGVVDDAWRLIAACLDKVPDRRPTAREVAVGWSALLTSAPPHFAPPVASGPEDRQSTGTAVRPVPVKPVQPPVPRKRRRWIAVAVAAVAVGGAGTGITLGLDETPAAPTSTASTTASTPAPTTATRLYPVAANISVQADGTGTLRWSAGTSRLPGLQHFIVLRVLGDETPRQVGAELPPTADSLAVSGVRRGDRTCFRVFGYGVTAPPPDPAPPLACTES